MDELIRRLAEIGIKGGTIIEGSGMASSLVKMEDLPFFSMLKAVLVDEGNQSCKVMLFVLKDEMIIPSVTTIKKVIGNFNAPNTGILFTMPITNVEGINE